MDKLRMQSKDRTQENYEKLAALFPNAITETIDENGEVVRAIDKDVLQQEINAAVVEGREERYQFTWPDKKRAVISANTPVNSTLRPCREESVDFDTTENLYIEGDNLEVLKLLQETYLGKIKMIYIDPPYNTGKDFVYSDKYSVSSEEWEEMSGDTDEYGNRLFQNNDSNGRFHTDWLNMMYPRLKLAKDLLCDNGAIFISLDDNEQENMKKMCDEIFGFKNFVANIKILSNPRGRQSSSFFATAGEYVFIYAKKIDCLEIIGDKPSEDKIATYNKIDDIGKYRDIGLRKRGADARREDSPTLFFPIFYNPISKDISLEKIEGYIEILPKLEDGSDGRWRWSPTKVNKDKHLLYCRTVNREGKLEYDVFQKDYLSYDKKEKHKNFWIEKEINYDRGAEEIRDQFSDKIFDFAKPVYLIKKIINTIVKGNCNEIILDFFSGSATTAHAVMRQNFQDVFDGKRGNRKFIMVQLPENTDEKSEAYKAGYKNICEIGKERIRRAGKNEYMSVCGVAGGSLRWNDEKKAELGDDYISPSDVDIGFRVLKLDSSNMKDVYYNPSDIDFNLLDEQVDNIKEDRTPEDLLFQVMLDLGILLSSKIEESDIAGKKVFNVADNFLIACFDENVNDEVITAVAKLRPSYFIMRDSSLASDSTSANFDQIFATYSPDTIRKVI